MSEIATLIKCLPVLLGLIKSIQDAIKAAETNEEVKDQLMKVKAAFDKKDASSLNDLFNKLP